ncbi:MAG: tetratricopeptide repeat protein [Candidatus Binatia bacterium]
MFRRILTFLLIILTAGAVGMVIYLNPNATAFTFSRTHSFTLPLGVLVLAGAVAGALLTFLVALLHEGRRALRAWRVNREVKSAQWRVSARAEARKLALAGNYANARSLLTRATRKGDPDVSDVIDFAETWLQEGKPEEARRVLDDGQSDFGNDPLLLYAIAKTSLRLGDRDAAVSALERALSVYPTSPLLLSTLRDVLFDQEAWQRAEEIQRRLVELRPGDETERNRLLGARYENAMLADDSEREALLRRVTDSDPDFAAALLERSRILVAQGQARRALRMLERAVLRTPRGVIFDELEGLCTANQADKLAKIYEKALAQHPGNAGLRMRATRFYLDQGNTAAAAAQLDGIGNNGAAGCTELLRSELYRQRGQADKAAESYTHTLHRSGFPRGAFVCSSCGHSGTQSWAARCRHCGSWSSLDSL